MSAFDLEPTRRDGHRLVKFNWVLGGSTNERGEPTVAEAQLSIHHDANRKAYTAVISRVDTTDWGGHRTESFMIVGGTRVRLTSYPCARFSVNGLGSAVTAALAEVRSRATEPELIAVSDPASPA